MRNIAIPRIVFLGFDDFINIHDKDDKEGKIHHSQKNKQTNKETKN